MQKRIYMTRTFYICIGILHILIACQQGECPYQKSSGYTFGTQYHITYQSPVSYQNEIEEVLARIDASLSAFNPKSTLSRINKNLTQEADSDCLKVIRMALDISQKTEGAFDITVAPMVNAWGFGFKNAQRVTSATIDSLKNIVGYQRLSCQGNRIKKSQPEIQLDCSAIAKGYACEEVARMLENKGIENYLVEIGGEIQAKGINQSHKIWNIGIAVPEEDSLADSSSPVMTILCITNAGIATSGNYRNFYYKDGKKYAHTIDPRTGHPVQHSILSSTVIAPTCAEADAYATAFMVTGLEKAQDILQHNKHLKAYFIYSNSKGQYRIWKSPNMTQQ